MIRVEMFEEAGTTGDRLFLAVAGRTQAMGRTRGEAIDALSSQFEEGVLDSILVVRKLAPDAYFPAEPRCRLEELTQRRRELLASSQDLSPEQLEELEQLVDAETEASLRRAKDLARDLGQ